MYQLATAPRGIGQVLDSVFQLARTAFGRLLPFALISGVLGIVPFVYLFMSGAMTDQAALATLAFSPGYWLSVGGMAILMIVIYGAALVRGESIAQGEDVGLGASFGRAAPLFLTMLLAGILYAIVLGIGMVLLIVPGLIVMVSLYMFLPAIVLDGKGIVESLKYSHGLVWGNWWRTATVVTIAVVIMYVLFVIIGLVLGFFFAFGGVDPVTVFLVQGVTSFLGGLLVMPFFCALYLEVYRDLKMRKTGGDLAARIESAGTAR